MSLEVSRLQNVHDAGDGVQARCPACAEAGLDRKGVHLRVYKDGRFGCVVHAGADGVEHRKRIFALVGKPSQPKTGFTVRVNVVKVTQSLSIKSALNYENHLYSRS